MRSAEILANAWVIKRITSLNAFPFYIARGSNGEREIVGQLVANMKLRQFVFVLFLGPMSVRQQSAPN